jgi:uncharacterized protein YbjT (DUF2867 family)
MAMDDGERIRVLIIGGTGYFGRRLVKASLALGHETYVLYRAQAASDINKVETLISFKSEGAHLVEASIDNHRSLVNAVKRVEVVISAMGSEGLREGQLKVIEAIKEAGTIKRFLPSEFGMDPDRMEHAIYPGNEVFSDKRAVRRAIEAAGIPYTYVSANCYAGYFLASLAQMEHFMPPRDGSLTVYGDGNKKVIWVDEDDIATYTLSTINDPRTLNTTLYLRPPANVLSLNEVVAVWERLIGKSLQKKNINEEQWLQAMNGAPYQLRVVMAHIYQIFFRGDLDFEMTAGEGLDSSELYPQVKYVTVEEYLQRFL